MSDDPEEVPMATVEVFDPPMCCSTGVCGPSVDPALAAFAADLGWLGEQGVAVERHNLSQEPKAFADRDLVRGLLAERGDEALPAVVVDGALRASGRYPSRDELAAWAMGARVSERLDAVTAELVAIGAAGDAPEAREGCCGGDAAAGGREAAVVASGCCGGATEVAEVSLSGVASDGEASSGCCG